MKIARYKRVQRYLLFYRNNFGFSHVGSSKRQIVVLADGTFCKAALDNKLNIQEQLRVYFNQDVKILTTSCVIRELELLGGEFYGALHIAKQYKKISCRHQVKFNEPTPAAQCIFKAVGQKNEDQLFVATQDPALTEQLKSTVAACPILFIRYRTVLLDRPSPFAVETAQGITNAKLTVEDTKKKEFKSMKRKLIGEETDVKPKKKRRKIKGPNPLSCKKRKRKAEVPKDPEKTEIAGDGTGEKKRKRKQKGEKVDNSA